MPPNSFRCTRCGHCCTNLEVASLPCDEEDYQRWVRQERWDILEWVNVIRVGGRIVLLDMWMDPRTGDNPGDCPWVSWNPADGAFSCRIHDSKPKVCQDYPVSEKHARETGCRGFDR